MILFLKKSWLWIVLAIGAYFILRDKALAAPITASTETIKPTSINPSVTTVGSSLPAIPTGPSNPSISTAGMAPPILQSQDELSAAEVQSSLLVPTSPSNPSIPLMPSPQPIAAIPQMPTSPATAPSNPSIPSAQTIRNEPIPAGSKLAVATILSRAFTYLRSIRAKKFLDAQPINSTYWYNEASKMKELTFTDDQIKESIINFYS
jgi:hypothetical protein